ncbi:MAG: histidine kinase dimerization/phosphoacceptor domain -containing protein [Flavobacteriaceae bacterium]
MKIYYYTILFFICISSFAQGKSTSIKKTDSIYQNLKEISLSKAKSLEVLGVIGALNYPVESKKIIDEILKFSLENNYTNQIADSYYSMGNYYFFNSKLDSSLITLKKAETYLDKTSQPLLKASIVMTEGGIYQRKGNVIKANHKFLESLEILDKVDTLKLSKKEKRNRKGKKMVLLNSLAIFNKNTGDYEVANTYYNSAYKMALDMGNMRIAGILLSNQGDLLIKTKKYDEALRVLKKSKKIKIENRDSPKSKGVTDLNIAMVYTAQNKFDAALTIFNKIIPLFRQLESTSNLMYSLVGRGQLYNKKGAYQKAIKDCKEAYNLAIDGGDLEYQNSSTKCLSDAYKNSAEFEKAFYYQSKYIKFKDSIFNTDNIKKITQLEMQYEFEKQNALKEIEIKNKENESSLIIKSLFFGVLGLLLLLGLLYKLYFNRKKNNKILSSKNETIKKALSDNETLLKETHHRVKNSLQMISSLLYLQSENIEDAAAAASVKDGQIRVKSMALIHQKLYQKDNLTGVEVSEYINDLAESIFQSHNVNNSDIQLNIDVDKMILDIDTITPLGIIINELIVNILKHAFVESSKNPQISISLHKKNDVLELKVADNGKGIDLKERKEKSFGLKLIKSLSRKLKADLKITNNNGTLVELKIKRFVIK